MRHTSWNLKSNRTARLQYSTQQYTRQHRTDSLSPLGGTTRLSIWPGERGVELVEADVFGSRAVPSGAAAAVGDDTFAMRKVGC